MSYHHRHGAALCQLDQLPPERLHVNPPYAPPMPTYDFWCHECADEVIGDEYKGRLLCERCGSSDVVSKEDL